MKRRLINGWIILFINSYLLYSQQSVPVDKWMEYMEEVVAGSDDPQAAEALYDELSYRTGHPFDLNTVTAERLRTLPFLSDAQIGALLAYRRRYGGLASIYELKGIKEIDRQTLELLVAFVYVGPENDPNKSLTFKNIKKYGRNELAVRFDRCLQAKKGYQPVIDSLSTKVSGSRYLGEPYYQSLRYSFVFGEEIQAGLVAEKDAGEPFLRSVHRGYDFYSFHGFIRGRGMLKTLALGDYKASFGQGLACSQEFTPGRAGTVTQAGRRSNGFRRHYSASESGFFRGAALAAAWKNWEIDVFYSRKKTDATVEDGEIRSFKTDGLHRTVSEREKKNTVPVQTAGIHFRYATERLTVGCTGIGTSFGGLSVRPAERPDNLFDFRGRKAWNASVDYSWRSRRVQGYGEIACSGKGAFARLHACRLAPASYVSLLVLYRSYAKNYTAYYGRAFGQGSSVSNEDGIYVGLELTPVARWKVSGSADFFRFPWLQYGASCPASGREYRLETEYAPAESLTFFLRSRFREKGAGSRRQTRFRIGCRPAAEWNWQGAFDLVQAGSGTASRSRGWMVSQRFGWSPAAVPVQVDAFLACFRTDDYASRVFSYEKNLLYAFSLPAFYGKGIRWAVSFRVDWGKRFSLSAKAASTGYADRETIGSGLETIRGTVKTDIYALLRWKF